MWPACLLQPLVAPERSSIHCKAGAQGLGHHDSLAYEPWPQLDESLLQEDTFALPVQVLLVLWHPCCQA